MTEVRATTGSLPDGGKTRTLWVPKDSKTEPVPLAELSLKHFRDRTEVIEGPDRRPVTVVRRANRNVGVFRANPAIWRAEDRVHRRTVKTVLENIREPKIRQNAVMTHHPANPAVPSPGPVRARANDPGDFEPDFRMRPIGAGRWKIDAVSDQAQAWVRWNVNLDRNDDAATAVETDVNGANSLAHRARMAGFSLGFAVGLGSGRF